MELTRMSDVTDVIVYTVGSSCVGSDQ